MRTLTRHAISGLKAAIPVAALMALALIINDQGDRYLRREAQRNLVTLLNVISTGIETEYRQAMANVAFIASRPEIVAAAENLVAAPRNPTALLAAPGQQLARAYFAPLVENDLYQRFSIVAPDSTNLASSLDALVGQRNVLVKQPNMLARAWAGNTVLSQPQASDLQPPGHIDRAHNQAATSFAVSQIRDAQNNIIALLTLRINPEQTLFRTLEAGMTGTSGEAYIFDRTGIMLSESRFTPALWASGRLSDGQPSFRNLVLRPPGSARLTRMAASATRGESGVDTRGYLDYRGVMVVGAWQWLEDSDIGVAVEIDAGEVFSGLQLLQGAIFGVTLVAAALLVIIAEMTSLQKRRLEERVQERTAALNHEQSKLASLFEQAPSALITSDADGAITAFSARARLIFGYAEPEAVGMPLAALFAEPLPRLKGAPDTAHIEINGSTRDGDLVPLALSLSRVQSACGEFQLAIARDISESKRLELAMRDEIQRRKDVELRQRLLLDAAGEGIFGLDPAQRISFINPAGAELLGYQPGQLLGQRLADAVAGHPPACAADDRLAMPHDFSTCMRETVLRRSDGSRFEAQYSRSPLVDDGVDHGSVVVFSDISARKRTEQSLLLAESVFQHVTEGVLVADADGHILRVNRALCEMVGYSAAELIGQRKPPYRSGEHPPVFYQQMWDALQTEGTWEGEIWNRRKNGEIFPTWQTIVAIRDQHGRAVQFVSVTRDITEQRRSEQRIHRLAYFDNLTGLPNRELFFDRFAHAIQRAQRQENRLALLFLDLDRFKNVNDSLGHPIGDELLKAVAVRLQHLVRGEDTIARLGGDEFTILLESVLHQDNVIHVARKVVGALSQPFEIGGHRLHIGTSVGISLYPDDGENATVLVKHADAAMYQAKASGRNNYQFYAESMTSRTNEHVVLEANLYRAVQNDEFLLHYQPQYAVDGSLVGLEALIRWEDPLAGLVPPDHFIPLAEENGLIVVIGEWVLRTACSQMCRWRERGAPPLRLSVNLAGPQIMRGDIVRTVAAVLEQTGMPPDMLELEVTETFVMDNAEQAFSVLSQLRGLGVSIAIDDFGTGHSSLATLKHLPADTLKIDREFVRDIPDDANDMAIARAILAMGRQLNLSTVAEGVETLAQKAFLSKEGCDYFQGFLFSRPLPAESVEALWHDRKRATHSN